MKKYESSLDEIIKLSPLAELYEDGMEIQILTETDAFRITDKIPQIDKDKIVAIGLTGWNAIEKTTKYVTFDIDSFSNHKNGLSDLEMNDLLLKLEEIDFITIYRSTSGKGYHLYVTFTDPIPALTRKEHINISKYIRNKINILLGGGFNKKVDISGLVSWIWHREKMTDLSFKLIQEGNTLEMDIYSILKYEEVSNPITKIKINIELDGEHRALIDYLNDNKFNWWWEEAKQLLVTHTLSLVKAHKALGLKGEFNTNTTGSTKHNCFLVPLPNGAWIVRRFGNVEEKTWSQKNDYYFTYLNKALTLKEAMDKMNGVETPSGAYMFMELEHAIKALEYVNISIDVPAWSAIREAKIRKKNGRIILEFRSEGNDRIDQLNGWIKEGGYWKKIIGEDDHEEEKIDLANVDDFCRYLLNPDLSDLGWFINIDGQWSRQSLVNVKHRLFTRFMKDNMVKSIVGNMIEHAWHKVVKPFQPEYTGNREWNFGSRLNYVVGEDHGDTPAWDAIFTHLGESIDIEARADLGISGKQYLLYWVVAMLRNPGEPLSYLFFHGPQNSGKSMFHEALGILFHRGYVKADKALTNPQGFNGELENAVLCVIEETDLSKTNAYNRIKEWVTAKDISIHRKGDTPFMSKNYTHWIQASNSYKELPMFSGDTRITVIPVRPLEHIINKRDFMKSLYNEAQYFINKIYYLTIPEYNDRLLIPALMSTDKLKIESQNDDTVTTFINEYCEVGDYEELFSVAYIKFCNEYGGDMSKISFGKQIPLEFEKCKRKSDNQTVIKGLKLKQ